MIDWLTQYKTNLLINSSQNKVFCSMYIGQALERSHAEALNLVSQSDLASLPWLRRQLILHRRLIGFAIPASIFHLFWWAGMIKLNAWHLFAEKYYMSLTMIFGSLVSGMFCSVMLCIVTNFLFGWVFDRDIRTYGSICYHFSYSPLFWLAKKYHFHRKLYFVFSFSQSAPNASVSVKNAPNSLVHAWAQHKAPAVSSNGNVCMWIFQWWIAPTASFIVWAAHKSVNWC